jgi:hypothetical protein
MRTRRRYHSTRTPVRMLMRIAARENRTPRLLRAADIVLIAIARLPRPWF